jgi:hypothetical protein
VQAGEIETPGNQQVMKKTARKAAFYSEEPGYPMPGKAV